MQLDEINEHISQLTLSELAMVADKINQVLINLEMSLDYDDVKDEMDPDGNITDAVYLSHKLKIKLNKISNQIGGNR